MLWLYQRAFYGKASESVSHHMYDLTPREWAAIVPLLVLMVWMGTFTQSFLPSISAQNARILEQTASTASRSQRAANPLPCGSGGVACPLTSCPPSAEYFRVLPEIILTLVGVLIMFLEAVLNDDRRRASSLRSRSPAWSAALVGAIAAYGDPGPAFQNMLIVDGFATFFRVLVIGVGMLAVF